MAIEFWLGKPGSGKSYSAVLAVRDALRSGRVVLTNLPLSDDSEWLQYEQDNPLLFRIRPTASLDKAEGDDHFGGLGLWNRIFVPAEDGSRRIPDHLTSQINGKRAGPMIVVDEIGSSFSPLLPQRGGISTGKIPPHLVALTRIFETHRHYGVDIVLIGQSLPQVPAYWRDLAERAYEFRNTGGFLGKGRGNGQFYRLTRNHVKHFGTAIQPADKKRYSFQSSVYKLYDGFSEGGADGTTQAGRLKVVPLYLRWPFLMLAGSVVAVICLSWFAFGAVHSALRPDISSGDELIAATQPGGPNSPPAAGPVHATKRFDGIYSSGPVLLGYTDAHIFFVDGTRLGLLDDLPAAGLKLVAASSSRVVVIVEETDEPIVWSVPGAL